MNKIKEWLDKRGLKGGKLYAAIGAIVVIGLMFVVASLPKEAKAPAGPKSAALIPSASLGAIANQAGGSIQMPAVSPEYFNVKVQQFIDETKAWKNDRQKFEAEVLVQLRALKEHGTTDAGVSTQLDNLQSQITNIGDQLDSLRSGGFGSGAERDRRAASGPLQLITVPPKKKSESTDRGSRESGALRGGAGAAQESPFYLPAGSMVKATLLNGVEAPPSTQGPGLPVLLLVRDSFLGPNSTSLPMDGCMVLGRADGDLSSERVKIAVSLVSCVFPGGRTLDRAVQGYVSGPDGKLGIPGKVHDRRGRKLGMAVLAGFTAGLSQAIGQSEVTRVLTAEGTERTIVSGSTLTFGMSQALGSALAEVTNFYRQEIQRLFPVIEVHSGTQVTLVLEQGVDVPEMNALLSGIESVKGEE
ncbi:MAG: TraB/VirB10 family protein [Nitrospirae bacterium]|nr:TraB/VirB10 family protein [Nitrospirota bacterium]